MSSATPQSRIDYPGQPQQAVGVAVVQRMQLGGIHAFTGPLVPPRCSVRDVMATWTGDQH